MDALIHVLLGFPLGVFTLALGLLLLYWLLVILRLVPLECFEHDSLKGDHLASTLVALGFAGVPASVALTVLLAIAGALTLALELLVLRWLPLGLLRIPVGVAVLWGALALASPLAAGLCRALHPWFHRHGGKRCLLGETVVVGADCDEDGCTRATLADDPAHEVRLHGKAEGLPRAGERRVLVKYLADEERYRSVPLQEFEEARARLRRLRRGRRPNGGRAASH